MRGRDPLLPVLAQLSDRDRHLLELLHDHKVLTTEQIATALFPNLDTAQHRLVKLYRLGTIERFRWLREGGGSYSWRYTIGGYAFFKVPYVGHAGRDDRRLRRADQADDLAGRGARGGHPGVGRRRAHRGQRRGQGHPGYRAMGGAFVGVLIVVGTLGAFLGTRGAPVGRLTESEPSLRAQLAVARGNRPFRLLLACWVVQAAGIATMLAGVNYFAEQVLHSQAAKTLLFVCFVGPALLVMPVWARVGERLGKLRGYWAASLLFVLGALLLGGAHAVPALRGPAVAYLVTALIGAGYAGQQVFGMAMLPDCIARDAERTDPGRSGPDGAGQRDLGGGAAEGARVAARGVPQRL